MVVTVGLTVTVVMMKMLTTRGGGGGGGGSGGGGGGGGGGGNSSYGVCGSSADGFNDGNKRSLCQDQSSLELFWDKQGNTRKQTTAHITLKKKK